MSRVFPAIFWGVLSSLPLAAATSTVGATGGRAAVVTRPAAERLFAAVPRPALVVDSRVALPARLGWSSVLGGGGA